MYGVTRFLQLQRSSYRQKIDIISDRLYDAVKNNGHLAERLRDESRKADYRKLIAYLSRRNPIAGRHEGRSPRHNFGERFAVLYPDTPKRDMVIVVDVIPKKRHSPKVEIVTSHPVRVKERHRFVAAGADERRGNLLNHALAGMRKV